MTRMLEAAVPEAPQPLSRAQRALAILAALALLLGWAGGALFAYNGQSGYWTRLFQEAHWLDAASLTYENSWFSVECPKTHAVAGECPVGLTGGLPLSAEVPFASREQYLEAFANHRLHLVEQRFDYNPQSVRPVRYEQVQELRVQSAICQCTVSGPTGSVAFVKDHGVYRDTRPHGVYRNGLGLRDFSNGILGAMLGAGLLLLGCAIAVAKGTLAPLGASSGMALGLLTHGHWHLLYFEVMRYSMPF